jgi:hypothetical protein
MAVYPVTPISDGSTVRELHHYDVIVYQEGGHYYAKDSRGNLICVDSPTACLQEAVNAVGENSIIMVKGDFRNYKLTIQDKSKVDVIFDWLNRVEVINSDNIGIFGKVVGGNGILIQDSYRVRLNVDEVYGQCDIPAIELATVNSDCGWHSINVNTVATAPYNGPACGTGILLNPSGTYTIEGNVIMVYGTIFGSSVGVQLNTGSHWNRIFVDVDNGPAGGSASVVVNQGSEYNLIVLWGVTTNPPPPQIYSKNIKVISQAHWDVVPDTWIDNWQPNGMLDIQNPWHYTFGFKDPSSNVKGVHINNDGFINLFKNPNMPFPTPQIIFSDNLFTRASQRAYIQYNTSSDILYIIADMLRLNAIARDPPTTISISPGSTYTVPTGAYYVLLDSNTVAEVNINNTWYTVIQASGVGLLIADQSGNTRLRNTSTSVTSSATLIRTL